jgi:hypothetical protein
MKAAKQVWKSAAGKQVLAQSQLPKIKPVRFRKPNRFGLKTQVNHCPNGFDK